MARGPEIEPQHLGFIYKYFYFFPIHLSWDRGVVELISHSLIYFFLIFRVDLEDMGLDPHNLTLVFSLIPIISLEVVGSIPTRLNLFLFLIPYV